MERGREGVSAVKLSGNVRGRNWNDEGALRVDFLVVVAWCGILGLEETLLLPPVIPSTLNNLGDIGRPVRVFKATEDLLFAYK